MKKKTMWKRRSLQQIEEQKIRKKNPALYDGKTILCLSDVFSELHISLQVLSFTPFRLPWSPPSPLSRRHAGFSQLTRWSLWSLNNVAAVDGTPHVRTRARTSILHASLNLSFITTGEIANDMHRYMHLYYFFSHSKEQDIYECDGVMTFMIVAIIFIH